MWYRCMVALVPGVFGPRCLILTWTFVIPGCVIVGACGRRLGSRAGPIRAAIPGETHRRKYNALLGGRKSYVAWCSTTHVMSSGGRRALDLGVDHKFSVGGIRRFWAAEANL